MDPLSGSLLIPLMIEFFKERRDRQVQANFAEFRAWVEETLPEVLCTSEETFLLLKTSSEINSRKLERALEMLENLTDRSKPVDLADLWAELSDNEQALLQEMFSELPDTGQSDVDVVGREELARILAEVGYAHVHVSSASCHASLTSAGVVLAWSALSPSEFFSFERRLPTVLPKQPSCQRLGKMCAEAKVNEHLANAVMELLCENGLIHYQNDTWPPSNATIHRVSERLVRGDFRLNEILAKSVSASKSS